MRKWLFLKMWDTPKVRGVCACGDGEGHTYVHFWKAWDVGRNWCWRTWVTNTFGLSHWGPYRPRADGRRIRFNWYRYAQRRNREIMEAR